MIDIIILFFIGILECFLSALNIKFLQRGKKIACFIISTLSIFIWYYLLVLLIENLKKFWLITFYAIGFGLGDVLALWFDQYLSKLAKSKGIKMLRKKFRRRKK